MDEKRSGANFPGGLCNMITRRAGMFFDEPAGGDPGPAVLEIDSIREMPETIEVVDDKSANDVIVAGRLEFNKLLRAAKKDTTRLNEVATRLEKELKAAKERETAMEARVNTLSRSAPEWKLEDGSLAHVAKRLVAPQGIRQDYFNATVLKPEEMRFMSSLRDDELDAFDPYTRHWARKYKVDEKLSYLIEEMHALNDTIIFADIALAGRGERTRYGKSGHYAQRIQSLPWWSDWQKVTKDVQRAMHTTNSPNNQGIDWVPYFMSANLKLLVQAAYVVASLFETITMPTASYDNPVEGQDAVVYLIGQATSDTETTNVITTSTPKTAKMTLTAVKLALRILLSSEILEDSIINVASDVLRRIAKAFARGIENTIINGDLAATHQDYDVHSDANTAKRQERAWDGLRKHALISGMPNQDLATFSSANLLNIRRGMGVFGSRPSELVWIVGFKGMIEMMKLAELITMEKYGQQASVLTGEVAKFFGSPVVLSEFIREDVTGANVINENGGTNTKSFLLCVHRESFAKGERRAITINSSDDRHIETDQTVVVGTYRGDFKPWFSTAAAANKIVGIGRNFG